MRLNLTPLKSAIAGAALAASSAAAPAQELTPAPQAEAAKDEVAKLRANLDAALTRLATAEAKLKAHEAKIDEQATTILKLNNAVEGNSVSDSLAKKITDLDAKFKELQKDYDKLAARTPSDSTTAAKPAPQPMASPAAPIAAGTGVVKIINRYGVPAKVVLNGKTYVVEPNREELVVVAAPEFNYELIGGGDGPKPQPIRAGETLNLTIN